MGHRSLGTASLKDGTIVGVGCVGEGADGAGELWSKRLRELLQPWGHPWTTQVDALLTRRLARFYVLYDLTSPDAAERAAPFAQITLCEASSGGGGMLGNVWTSTARRRNGAMRALLRATLADFRGRGGRALVLGTAHGNAAYRMYEAEGFAPVEAGSGYMTLYNGGVGGRRAFERALFATEALGGALGAPPRPARVEPLAWRHYAASPWLFILGTFPGVVRNAPLSLMGRISTELPLIALIEAQEARAASGEPASAVALVRQDDGAVVGFGSWDWEKVIPNAAQLDVFCHPLWWSYAPALIRALPLPRSAERFVVSADTACPTKVRVCFVDV